MIWLTYLIDALRQFPQTSIILGNGYFESKMTLIRSAIPKGRIVEHFTMCLVWLSSKSSPMETWPEGERNVKSLGTGIIVNTEKMVGFASTMDPHRLSFFAYDGKWSPMDDRDSNAEELLTNIDTYE